MASPSFASQHHSVERGDVPVFMGPDLKLVYAALTCSVDLFFGPGKPEGVNENNFVLTKPGEGWFTYFRFYGPLDAYFDKTWVPNDFEKVGN